MVFFLTDLQNYKKRMDILSGMSILTISILGYFSFMKEPV